MTETAIQTCSTCKGKGKVWTDCGDSTCDCGGSDIRCWECKGTGRLILSGAQLIELERERQIKKECWTAEHDDEHDACELTMAASVYLYSVVGQVNGICWPDIEANVPNTWPWDDDSFKPSPDPIRNLAKAGALIAAEIDRLVRATSEPATSDANAPAQPRPIGPE